MFICEADLRGSGAGTGEQRSQVSWQRTGGAAHEDGWEDGPPDSSALDGTEPEAETG